jgi:hypothetical protein
VYSLLSGTQHASEILHRRKKQVDASDQRTEAMTPREASPAPEHDPSTPKLTLNQLKLAYGTDKQAWDSVVSQSDKSVRRFVGRERAISIKALRDANASFQQVTAAQDPLDDVLEFAEAERRGEPAKQLKQLKSSKPSKPSKPVKRVFAQDPLFDEDELEAEEEEQRLVAEPKRKSFLEITGGRVINWSEGELGDVRAVHVKRQRVDSPKKRVPFSKEEVRNLEKGVAKFGVGKWSDILQKYSFHPSRDSVSLKDKWRNLQKH